MTHFKKELMVDAGPAHGDARRPSRADAREYRVATPISRLALRYGAEGIGLLRSEFSFLTYEDFPDEEQQLALYNRMLEAFGKRPVTIRTLDIGADKYPPYLRVPREDNPFLGWRSIRISLELPGVVQGSTARDPARRRRGFNVRIMFPMISSIEELRRASELLAEAQAELFKEGLEHNPASKSASWSRCRRRYGLRRGWSTRSISSRLAPTT